MKNLLPDPRFKSIEGPTSADRGRAWPGGFFPPAPSRRRRCRASRLGLSRSRRRAPESPAGSAPRKPGRGFRPCAPNHSWQIDGLPACILTRMDRLALSHDAQGSISHLPAPNMFSTDPVRDMFGVRRTDFGAPPIPIRVGRPERRSESRRSPEPADRDCAGPRTDERIRQSVSSSPARWPSPAGARGRRPPVRSRPA